VRGDGRRVGTTERRFASAVGLAADVHGAQRQIGTRIPYLAHMLVVTGLVLEDGGDEDEAIAAMLHDTSWRTSSPPAGRGR